MKSIWWTYCFFSLFIQSPLPHIHVHKDHFYHFSLEGKTHTSHNTFVVSVVPLCTTFGSSWLRLIFGFGSAMEDQRVHTLFDAIACSASVFHPPTLLVATPSMPCQPKWWYALIRGDLAWLKTTFAEAVDFDFNCFNPENNLLRLGEWWELTIETRSKKASTWRVDISLDLSFFCNWICWIIDYEYWTSLLVIFYLLNCLEQWFPRVAWIEDFPSRQISEASASHINHRSLVPHKTNNSN